MITALSLDPFTRDLWGEVDAYARAQISALAYDPCFRPKFYAAPDLTANNLNAANSANLGYGFGPNKPGIPGTSGPGQNYAEYGLSITPGSLIVGSYLFTTSPTAFMVQITDVSLGHSFYDQPVPACFLGNSKGDFPNLWNTPHPVVGSGLFRCEFGNQNEDPQIIQVVLAVLDPCEAS